MLSCFESLTHTSLCGEKKPLYNHWVHIVVSIGCRHFFLFFFYSRIFFHWLGWNCHRYLWTTITNRRPIECIHMKGTRHTVHVCTITNGMSVYKSLTKYKKPTEMNRIACPCTWDIESISWMQEMEWNKKIKRIRIITTMVINSCTYLYVHQAFLYSSHLRWSINISFYISYMRL